MATHEQARSHAHMPTCCMPTHPFTPPRASSLRARQQHVATDPTAKDVYFKPSLSPPLEPATPLMPSPPVAPSPTTPPVAEPPTGPAMPPPPLLPCADLQEAAKQAGVNMDDVVQTNVSRSPAPPACPSAPPACPSAHPAAAAPPPHSPHLFSPIHPTSPLTPPHTHPHLLTHPHHLTHPHLPARRQKGRSRACARPCLPRQCPVASPVVVP